MQTKQLDDNYKKIDSYSALICAKYFKTKQDFINLICVNSKFKETTDKFRYNPISIKSLKLFPKIQTQHLYERGDEMIKRKQIIKYEIWYDMDYKEYTQYGNNIMCHSVEYTENNREEYGEKIPACVTLISDYCFTNCSLLTSINLPSSLQSLGNHCFYECSKLSSINLPSSLKSLGDGCFCGCSSLATIDLPSLLSSLGDGCFYECSSLSSINIPSSLTSLGEFCFSGCLKLKGVIDVPDYCFDSF
ncbi:Leucine rich repeat containing protein BspA family protein [Entamoeba marina]